MPNRILRLAIGATTGALGLIAMIRLVSGAFSGGMGGFAWMAILLAMLPWIGYCAWRAWRAQLLWRSTVAVVGLCIAGIGLVWILTLGPVVALACSMVAFSVIWLSDRPPRRPRGAETFVKVEELKTQHLQ
jgi:hypothetical protein